MDMKGSADFSQHPLERIILLIINIGEALLGLVCLVVAIAGASGQLEGAGSSFNLMFAFVGTVTFLVGTLGTLGVLKYNNLMYVYFLFMSVSTIFVLCVVLFVATNRDVVVDEVKNEAQDQWESGNGYEEMPTIVQNFLSNTTEVRENCGDFHGEDPTFEECWAWAKTLVTDTYLTYCIAFGVTILIFMLIASICSLRVVGIHDIIKRTQHIVNIALGINGLVTIIFGVAVYVTLNDPSFEYGAYMGYFVLATGFFILLTAILGFFSQKGGVKSLQMVYIIICGVMTIMALAFALVAFFGSSRVEEQALECESCQEAFNDFCNVTSADENVAKLGVDDEEFDEYCFTEGAYVNFVNNCMVALGGAGYICLFVFLFMVLYDIGAVIVLRTESEMGEETMGLA